MTHDLAWHEERQGGIGASQAAAIIGLSPWQTAHDVWEYITSPAKADEGPTPLRFWLGLRLEPVIAELFEARTGDKLRRPPKRYWHPNGVMHCELDYLVTGKREHVECKVANFGEEWGADGSVDIPAHYYPQVQAQLAVTGNQVCHVAALWHGQELRVYRIERNEPYIADLEDLLQSWHHLHVTQGVEPPLTGPDEAVVRRRFPRAGEEEMVATPELALEVEALRLARLNMAQAKRAEDDHRVRIMDAMGSAQKLVGDGFSITYRNNKDGEPTVNWELVAKAYRAALLDADGRDSWIAGTAMGAAEEVADSTPQGALTIEERLDAIESLYTSPGKPGARVFRPTWSDKQG